MCSGSFCCHQSGKPRDACDNAFLTFRPTIPMHAMAGEPRLGGIGLRFLTNAYQW